MRSWSIPVGRLFGVDIRIHLTFFVLPMFIFWTEYAVHQGSANGPRDLALAGIILGFLAVVLGIAILVIGAISTANNGTS